MNRKTSPYGTFKDFPKIHIYTGACGILTYAVSTTWARTCKEAIEQYAIKHNVCKGNIKANFAKDNKMRIIYKTIRINNRNLQYWSDDGGVSWYWIGSRKPII